MSPDGRDGPTLPGQLAGWLLIEVIVCGFIVWMWPPVWQAICDCSGVSP